MEILRNGTDEERKALFSFGSQDSDARVLLKFNLWVRYNFPKYFSSRDAEFHRKIDAGNLAMYRGNVPQQKFLDIAFRGASKTARTKLFLAFVISCDKEHFRKYMKVLAEDGTNSKQIVTDVYNMLNAPSVTALFAEIFIREKGGTNKREETMSSFTTSTGVKLLADTVGSDGGRGALQEEARPDLILFEDFENRKTLRSNQLTKKIWDNMEEARTGLAKGGRCIYNCNYVSEQGNVHRLVMQDNQTRIMLIVPIEDEAKNPTWPDRYTKDDIDLMRKDDDDFEGERLCKPSASKDVFFDRESLDRQPKMTPKKEVAGFKIFYDYNPSHRYAGGHDVAGGVGLDSSTSVFWDFDAFPARVVGTFKSNTIKPDIFGDEINREANMFGACLVAPEKNNHGHATIARLKQLEANIHVTQTKSVRVMEAQQSDITKEYGWNTNALTKPKMLYALGKAVEDGLCELNDPDLIAECMSYTRNDLIETEKDPRLTTRHFDLLIAAAIGWQMKDFAAVSVEKDENPVEEEEDKPLYPSIGL